MVSTTDTILFYNIQWNIGANATCSISSVMLLLKASHHKESGLLYDTQSQVSMRNMQWLHGEVPYCNPTHQQHPTSGEGWAEQRAAAGLGTCKRHILAVT